ncbi:hypothetical protein [Croceibacterium aestuarii]|uniref:hypothetical protein n=1 Tax=Croceibacterium aestuarii TaxID=3064139 RepID=UPI00272DDCD2|nr:hypothetical protein [Croceibacterium sp. D39]
MRNFRLHFEADGRGEAKNIEFDAVDPDPVFHLLMRENANRRATLWEGEKRVGAIVHLGEGLWSIER